MSTDFKNWDGWPENRTAIIAEVGINHNGDKDLAWEMIQSAHANGADFVKLQSFVTEEFLHPSLSYYSSTKSMELSFEAQKELFSRAHEAEIKLMTTPYDFASVDLVEDFTPPAYKIASMDADNIPLIRYIAKKGRPVLVSCGMADINEIKRIVSIMEQTENDKLVLVHCVSDYPTRPEDMNLSTIQFLKETFGYLVGLSDHSIGLFSSYIAASLGVVVIEKHFTINRSLAEKFPDADHNISIEPKELRDLREFCEAVPIMMGKAPRPFTENETAGRQAFRRGLYARRDIIAGEKLSLENTAFLRPVKGIKAGDWDDFIGREAKKKISKLQPIFLSDMRL